MSSLLQDVRHSRRMLAENSGFTAVAVLRLRLCCAACFRDFSRHPATLAAAAC
jgi:hypothetical protein